MRKILPEILTIQVTQDDINHGVRNSCTDCPINRAAARELGISTSFIATFPNWLKITIPEIPLSEWYRLPDPARTFLKRFDQGQYVPALTFTVRKGT